jgi:hypothetical protein
MTDPANDPLSPWAAPPSHPRRHLPTASQVAIRGPRPRPDRCRAAPPHRPPSRRPGHHPRPWGASGGVWWRRSSSAGQSIGNKILGIRVLDADSGRSLPVARAFVRALMSNLSALPCFLGFFWVLWGPRKRTWHDIVADSLVVRASVYPSGGFARLAR